MATASSCGRASSSTVWGNSKRGGSNKSAAIADGLYLDKLDLFEDFAFDPKTNLGLWDRTPLGSYRAPALVLLVACCETSNQQPLKSCTTSRREREREIGPIPLHQLEKTL